MQNRQSSISLIILLLLSLTILLLTYPFLKYPFDMYHHLLWIEDYYSAPNKLPEATRYNWHYFWAHIFYILDIDNTKLFLRANIIHRVQIVVSFFSIYYFSYTLIKHSLLKVSNIHLHIISIWATIIWFTIYATASVGYHLVWFQWYSINYQITLPIIFLSIALTINYIFNRKIIYLFLAILTILIVFLFHSMEFIYYLMYMSVLALIYIDNIFKFAYKYKIYTFFAIVATTVLIYFLPKLIHLISYREPKLITYLLQNDLHTLWQAILRDGNALIHRFNRATDAYNELMVISLYMLIPLFVFSYILSKKGYVNIRFILFIAISSLFVLIPLYQILAGIASQLSYLKIVNRFYYSSSIFLILPLTIYIVLLFVNKNKQIIFYNFSIILFILLVVIFSKYSNFKNHNYYRNITSIINSFNENKVGFNLSKKQRDSLKKYIDDYEAKYGDNIIFFAREDIAFVLKHTYNKNVYLPIKWRGKRLDKNFYIKAYKDYNGSNIKKVMFKTPKNFPEYIPYK